MADAIDLSDLAATRAIGARIATMLAPGDVVTLSGPLGAGKTALAAAILAGLGHEGEVPSPTFAIVQPYEPPSVRLPVVHCDLYRLPAPEQVRELGIEDWLIDGAALIEWPEMAPAGWLWPRWRLVLASGAEGARRLTWAGGTATQAPWL